jgi:hypothetical protein
VRRWRELAIDREKWKDLLDRPKPTVGCSANGLLLLLLLLL